MHTRCAPVRHSRRPEGRLTVRLACIRPAASVHPEPGSNSSLYYCLSYLFSLNLGFPPPGASLRRCVPYLVPFFGIRLDALCWPQTFKELLPLSTPLCPSPRSFRKRVQKYYLFPYPQHLFSTIFHIFHKRLIYSMKFFIKFSIFPHKRQF